MYIFDKLKVEIIKYDIKNDIIKFKNIENKITDIKKNNINYNFMTNKNIDNIKIFKKLDKYLDLKFKNEKIYNKGDIIKKGCKNNAAIINKIEYHDTSNQ